MQAIVSAEAEIVSEKQCTCRSHNTTHQSPHNIASNNSGEAECDLHKNEMEQLMPAKPYIAHYNPYATREPESHHSYSESHL